MTTALPTDLPEFQEMGIAAVRLLQGVLYADDKNAWESLLSNESELTDYFTPHRVGLGCGSRRRIGLFAPTGRRPAYPRIRSPATTVSPHPIGL